MAAFTRADLFEKEFRRLLEEEIARLSEEIALGLLKSYEEYKFSTGKIVGLRLTLDYLDEASSIVSKKLA